MPTPSFGRPQDAGGPAFGAAGGKGMDMSSLPHGVDPPPGQKATDAISKTLAEVNPGQMQEVMAGMKVCIPSGTVADRRPLLQHNPMRQGNC